MLWFIMCENTFALATPETATESVTKYNYLVSHLPLDTASLIHDILLKHGATDPYTQLKMEIINRQGVSTQRKIRQLLAGEELSSSGGL